MSYPSSFTHSILSVMYSGNSTLLPELSCQWYRIRFASNQLFRPFILAFGDEFCIQPYTKDDFCPFLSLYHSDRGLVAGACPNWQYRRVAQIFSGVALFLVAPVSCWNKQSYNGVFTYSNLDIIGENIFFLIFSSICFAKNTSWICVRFCIPHSL